MCAGFVADSFRWGSSSTPLWETLAIAAVVAAMLVACMLIATHLHRRERRAKRVADQWQALAVMGELCPRGWKAQITLSGCDAPRPDGAPDSREPLVALEWLQFDEPSRGTPAAWRVWAPSIGAALQQMVEDRASELARAQDR